MGILKLEICGQNPKELYRKVYMLREDEYGKED